MYFIESVVKMLWFVFIELVTIKGTLIAGQLSFSPLPIAVNSAWPPSPTTHPGSSCEK